MGKSISNIDKFHNTAKGKLVFAVVELLLAYLVASRAIDTGSLWQYLVALLLFIGGLNNLVRAARRQSKPDAARKAKKR